jgi:hypothetical protein
VVYVLNSPAGLVSLGVKVDLVTRGFEDQPEFDLSMRTFGFGEFLSAETNLSERKTCMIISANLLPIFSPDPATKD